MARAGMILMNGRNEIVKNGVKKTQKSFSRHFNISQYFAELARLFNPLSQYGKSSVCCIVITGGQCNNLIPE